MKKGKKPEVPISSDAAYKKLFSHPEMIQDLLEHFIRQPWVKEVDFSTLAPVKGSFVSKGAKNRDADTIWRLQWEEREIFIYILLEFQSTPDPWMAVRMLTYIGLLYQDLIAQKIPSGLKRGTGKLPPVLPIVLYNGERKWGCETEIGKLIEKGPRGITPYLPELKYFLIDEGAMDLGTIDLESLVGRLIQLERVKDSDQFLEVMGLLAEFLGKPGLEELARSFTVMLRYHLLPKLTKNQPVEFMAEDLQETNNMLAKTMERWTREWKREGIKEGLKEGLQKGLRKGRSEGLQKGQQEVVQKLFKSGMSPKEIAEITDFSLKQVIEMLDTDED